MIRQCTLNDLAAVDFVLKHPRVYPFVRHDYTPPPEQYTAKYLLVDCPRVYVLMDDSNSFVGIAESVNGALYAVHQNVMPEIRGRMAVKICRAMIDWIFENTTAKKMIGYVPEPNRAAKFFALRGGFSFEYRLEKAYQLDGKLYALDIVSVEKRV
jgi:hypothetical protein